VTGYLVIYICSKINHVNTLICDLKLRIYIHYFHVFLTKKQKQMLPLVCLKDSVCASTDIAGIYIFVFAKIYIGRFSWTSVQEQQLQAQSLLFHNPPTNPPTVSSFTSDFSSVTSSTSLCFHCRATYQCTIHLLHIFRLGPSPTNCTNIILELSRLMG
jgi:hypothetical protein